MPITSANPGQSRRKDAARRGDCGKRKAVSRAASTGVDGGSQIAGGRHLVQLPGTFLVNSICVGSVLTVCSGTTRLGCEQQDLRFGTPIIREVPRLLSRFRTRYSPRGLRFMVGALGSTKPITNLRQMMGIRLMAARPMKDERSISYDLHGE